MCKTYCAPYTSCANTVVHIFIVHHNTARMWPIGCDFCAMVRCIRVHAVFVPVAQSIFEDLRWRSPFYLRCEFKWGGRNVWQATTGGVRWVESTKKSPNLPVPNAHGVPSACHGKIMCEGSVLSNGKTLFWPSAKSLAHFGPTIWASNSSKSPTPVPNLSVANAYQYSVHLV